MVHKNILSKFEIEKLGIEVCTGFNILMFILMLLNIKLTVVALYVGLLLNISSIIATIGLKQNEHNTTK